MKKIKEIWYILILFFTTIYVFVNRYIIDDFEKMNARNIIFLLWLLIIILPFFSEIDFYGIKMKKEIEKAKNELIQSISNFQILLAQQQITSSINNTFNIGDPNLASKKEMDELLEKIDEGNKNPAQDDNVQNMDSVNDEAVYFFKMRYEIEFLVRDLLKKIGFNDNLPLAKMVSILKRTRALDQTTLEVIEQVVKISNRGIHGEILSDEYKKFVTNAYPKIQYQLTNAINKLHFTVCPRCNYSGASVFENVCPQCNFISDDD